MVYKQLLNCHRRNKTANREMQTFIKAMTFFGSILSIFGCGKDSESSHSTKGTKSTANEIALIGEISGNRHALQAVLADIDARGIKRIYCLGGVAGFGANPNECIDELRMREIPTIRSFFDDCLSGGIIDAAQDYLKQSFQWTKEELRDDNVEWISSLPYTLKVGSAILCNADFYKPEEHGYLDKVATVNRSFHALNEQGYFVGFLAHSHVPASFFLEDPIKYSLDTSINYGSFRSVILNVGSVGQPRDDNPKACYAIWNPTQKKVEWVRIPYDIEGAQAAIRAAQLPEHLARRLQDGQ